VLPALGPYAAAPAEFAGLRHTAITDTQAEYLLERATFLADPSAPDAFVSLGAFASLHVGFTTLVFLMARYYGLRRTSHVLAVYLGAVIVSTVYFGWHYVSDDIAGVLLALTAVQLGKWTVAPPQLWPRSTTRTGATTGSRREAA
jgi:membrane-associated phospholipid phosphatase